jgi:hypothetical protein
MRARARALGPRAWVRARARARPTRKRTRTHAETYARRACCRGPYARTISTTGARTLPGLSVSGVFNGISIESWRPISFAALTTCVLKVGRRPRVNKQHVVSGIFWLVSRTFWRSGARVVRHLCFPLQLIPTGGRSVACFPRQARHPSQPCRAFFLWGRVLTCLMFFWHVRAPPGVPEARPNALSTLGAKNAPVFWAENTPQAEGRAPCVAHWGNPVLRPESGLVFSATSGYQTQVCGRFRGTRVFHPCPPGRQASRRPPVTKRRSRRAGHVILSAVCGLRFRQG